MGRDADFSFSEYVFTYLGAPLYNLDSVLSSSNHINNANIWGQQSFKGLYSFFYKISGQEKNIIDNINVFNFSRNGIETGNVYTTFYPFYYDFGYIGIMPLIMVIALYYINNYKLLIQDKRQKMSLINFRLFIFSYLYNDLIMLVFSNRFYGTIFDISFIKMIIIAWLLKSICIDREFRINKYILKLKRIRIGK